MAGEGTQIAPGPVGRIVWGHPGKPQKKTDQRTRQPILKDGKPIDQWTFGVAYTRADFEAFIWPVMAAEIAKGYPSGAPQGFSYKYKDGDNAISRDGKKLSDREGYAGHYVMTISTEAFAPSIVKLNAQQNGYDQLTPEMIKTGDYVRVPMNIKVNVPTDRTHTPGLYVNPLLVEFVGYGTEIVGQTVDPMSILGGQAAALPPGASATPTAPISSVAPPGMPGVAPPPALAPAPGMTAPLAPPAPPPPAAPAALQRPVDPSHIAHAGTPAEQWWNGAAWVPAPVAAPPPTAPTLPPPAAGFVAGAGMPTPPGMPGGAPAAPGGMPGMPPAR